MSTTDTSASARPESVGKLMASPANEQVLAQARRHGRLVLIVFSGEFDKLMAAFTLATAAAAMGVEVKMFFTFWGVLGLRCNRRFSGKSWLDRLLTAALPSGLGARVSHMNFLGLGAPFFAFVMRTKKVSSLAQLVDLARQLGVKMIACQMSMTTMGVAPDELMEGLEFGGAGRAVGELQSDAATLFI